MTKNEFTVKCQQDPIYFIHKVLGIKYLTPQQEEIIKSVWNNKYTGVKASHTVGKTFVLACIALTFLITNCDSRVISTAPTVNQVREQLWAEINHIYANAPYSLGGEINLLQFKPYPEKYPKWSATGFTVMIGKEQQAATSFQGFHSGKVLIILDEAVGIHPAIWEAVDGIASNEDCKIIAVGNPMTTNCAFFKYLQYHNWNKLTISAFSHPNVINKREIVKGAVSYSWVRDKVLKWCEPTNEDGLNVFEFEGQKYKPNDLFLWKVLGEFPQEGSDNLISLYHIQQAQARRLQGDICHLGIDVARFGTDKSVFCLNRGNNFSYFPFYHFDIARLTGKAIELIQQYMPSRVAVDCDGIGAGVYDNLKEALDNKIIFTELYEVHGGSTPLLLNQTEEFLNLRAQMYWLLRGDINLIGIENIEEITEELSMIKYFFNSKGKIQIEAKEEIKKRLGQSCDYADATAYCNFMKYAYDKPTIKWGSSV